MTDLPTGYRWANEDEDIETPGAIVVPLTVDSNGVRYTQGEADIAVPVTTPLDSLVIIYMEDFLLGDEDLELGSEYEPMPWEWAQVLVDPDDFHEVVRHCSTCGEPVNSSYAKSCCIDDNMIGS